MTENVVPNQTATDCNANAHANVLNNEFQPLMNQIWNKVDFAYFNLSLTAVTQTG